MVYICAEEDYPEEQIRYYQWVLQDDHIISYLRYRYNHILQTVEIDFPF